MYEGIYVRSQKQQLVEGIWLTDLAWFSIILRHVQLPKFMFCKSILMFRQRMRSFLILESCTTMSKFSLVIRCCITCDILLVVSSVFSSLATAWPISTNILCTILLMISVCGTFSRFYVSNSFITETIRYERRWYSSYEIFTFFGPAGNASGAPGYAPF